MCEVKEKLEDEALKVQRLKELRVSMRKHNFLRLVQKFSWKEKSTINVMGVFIKLLS